MASLLNGLTNVNSTLRDVNSQLTNSNPSQEPGKLNQYKTQIVGITKTATGIVANASNVAKTVADVSKKLGFGGISDALTGTDKITYTPDSNDIRLDDSKGELTGLKGFYKKFGGAQSKGINRADFLNTFECFFEFEPIIGTDSKSVDANNKIIQDTFLYKLLNDNGITEGYDRFLYSDVNGGYVPKNDFINKANAKVLDLGIYIQKLTLPNITTNASGNVQSMIGEFPINGTYVKPDTNNIQMDILNMSNSFHESIFYPWMREVQMNKWQYDSQPYTTANITIDFSEHCNIQYVFLNCRPTQIMTMQPSQEPNSTFSRQVTLTFDYMLVKKSNYYINDCEKINGNALSSALATLTTKEEKSTVDKILDIASASVFAASNTLKI